MHDTRNFCVLLFFLQYPKQRLAYIVHSVTICKVNKKTYGAHVLTQCLLLPIEYTVVVQSLNHLRLFAIAWTAAG